MARAINRIRQVAVLFISCWLLFSSAHTLASSDAYVSVEELTTELKMKDIDRVLRALNTVKQMTYQGEILPFIRDLWDSRKDKYPELPWATINTDIVKLDIANMLLQAAANGKTKIDREKIHRFVVGLISSTDIDVARNAILTLSLIDDAKDVGGILAIAKQKEKGTFRISVIALSKMCGPEATRALDQLEAAISEAEYKSYITKTRREAQSFKERTRWCEAARLG